MKHKIICGDCLDVMPTIPSNSVDMVLCDLPYGTTSCQWDSVIPFEPLWLQYKRIIKDNGAIVLTGSQPFTSALVMSNIDMFKYEWIWIKNRGTGHLNAQKRPLVGHEHILMFAKNITTYNPQMSMGTPYKRLNCRRETTNKGCYGAMGVTTNNINNGTRVPLSHIYFDKVEHTLHPTQKPVALFEYFIKTYTNENDTVLDNCLGSGTTCVSAENTNRNSIGIDILLEWCEKSYERLSNIVAQTKLGVTQSRIKTIGF